MGRKKTLKPGDRVELASGRDRGALGTVRRMTGSAVEVRLDDRPRLAGRTVSLLPSSVKKVPATAPAMSGDS